MMRLRTKFILVISILHMVTLVLSFYLFKDHGIYFIIAELLIIVSLIFSWQLYQQMLRPLQTLVDGIEAIKDKDFNVKFIRTGTYEMDRLIEVYNEMMDHLKTERTRQEQQHFFLEKLIQTFQHPTLIISPVVNFSTWDELAVLRRSSREIGAEGFMLKKRFYLPGWPKAWRLVEVEGRSAYH